MNLEIYGDNFQNKVNNSRKACRGIVIKDSKILLSYETKTGQYFLPGGGVEDNETLEECCIRELKEETGYLVETQKFYLTINEYYQDWLFQNNYFVCHEIGKSERKLTIREKEVGLKPIWLSISEAIEIFSKYPEYSNTNEMRHGAYLREYNALLYYFKDLSFKDDLTFEEAQNLDLYYSQHPKELLELDNKDIIRIIDTTEKILSYSLTKIDFNYYISSRTIGIKVFFDEKNLDEYLKFIELISYYKFDDYGLGLALGNYYYDKNKSLSLKFYQSVFSNGLNIGAFEYFEEVVKYLELLNSNPINELIKLIKNTDEEHKVELDFIKVYLFLIQKLDQNDDGYLEYLNEAIMFSKRVVKEYRNDNLNIGESDSDEERHLCELLSLKYEYYVNKKDYIEAFGIHDELTRAIASSSCTRYYHIRDKLYYQMLKDLSEEYPELKFFENLKNEKFEILEPIDNINNYLNKEITLKNSKGLNFKFRIFNIYKEEIVTLVPLLPLLKEGDHVYMNLVIENNKVYLENKM